MRGSCYLQLLLFPHQNKSMRRRCVEVTEPKSAILIFQFSAQSGEHMKAVKKIMNVLFSLKKWFLDSNRSCAGRNCPVRSFLTQFTQTSKLGCLRPLWPEWVGEWVPVSKQSPALTVKPASGQLVSRSATSTQEWEAESTERSVYRQDIYLIFYLCC